MTVKYCHRSHDSTSLFGNHDSATSFCTFSNRILLSRPNFRCPFFPTCLAFAMAFRYLSLSSIFCSRIRLFSSKSSCLLRASSFRFSASFTSFAKGCGFLRFVVGRGSRPDEAARSCDSGSSSMACRAGCNSRLAAGSFDDPSSFSSLSPWASS